LNWLVYLISGFLSGVIAGMGMGGGTVLVPALTLLTGLSQHAAQGINMLAFLPGAAVALVIHKKGGRIDLKSSMPLILSGVAGAVGGSFIAALLSSDLLRKLFGGFLAALAVAQFIWGEKRK
jgi:uncharacterized membrane protein YfcA